MSTKVIIAAPKPGHWPVKIQPQYLTKNIDSPNDPPRWVDSGDPERIEVGGCSKEYVVHQTHRLVVEEITGG